MEINDGKLIAKYLNGDGKIGIIPCFEKTSSYLYGGFNDSEVGKFINLPEKNRDTIINSVFWKPIDIAKLKSKNA